VAQKIVQRARSGPVHILCTREYQNSIRDSSKKLIEICIERMGFGASGDRFFTVSEREIRGRNGSVITFLGLNGKDAAIKSLEGYDLAWVEEAATLSQSSLDALIPTIRKENSEIWWTYNPRFATDPVDQLFRGQQPPPGTVLVEVQHYDNPWFPAVLARDMEYDRVRDPEKYAHVWLGKYVIRSEAQVFHNWQALPFESPADAMFRFGADWGYSNDPTVLVRCFIGSWAGEPGSSEVISDPKGKCLFVDYEAYAIGCPIDATPALFAGSDERRPARWENTRKFAGIPGATKSTITADSARPETIDYIKQRGFQIVPALKGAGSVQDGVNFLKSYDIVVHPRCRHLIDELVHYSWAVDRQTGEILSKLADAHNHVIDALRYALEGARKARNRGFEFQSAGRRAMVHLPGWDLHGDERGFLPGIYGGSGRHSDRY
jgi:phage terminase large subunit